MGHAPDGTPLIDPRIFDSGEFARNPYPYYRIMRDHYPVFHDQLHNCYFVTRYDDITACYFDEIGFNTIPKGSSSGVLGNTQLELSGIEHRRRRNIYGRHLVGAALTKRLHALRDIADELIAEWWDPANPKNQATADRPAAHRDRAGVRDRADRTRRLFRQRVPDQRRGPGARHPPGRPPTVHVVVRRDDVGPRRERHPPRRPRRAPGPRGLRGVARRGAAERSDVPLRRSRQRDLPRHHLRAVHVGDRRRRHVDRGDHVVRGPHRRRRGRDHPRRDHEPLVPAAPASGPVRGRPERPVAVDDGLPRDAAPLDLDRRSTSTQHVRPRAARRARPCRLADAHGRRVGEPRRPDLHRPGTIRHLPIRPLQRQDPAVRPRRVRSRRRRSLQPHGVRRRTAPLPRRLDLPSGGGDRIRAPGSGAAQRPDRNRAHAEEPDRRRRRHRARSDRAGRHPPTVAPLRPDADDPAHVGDTTVQP